MKNQTRSAIQRPISKFVFIGLWALSAFLIAWMILNVSEGISLVGLFGDRNQIWILLFSAALQGAVSMSFFLLPTFFLNPQSTSGYEFTFLRTFIATMVTAISLGTIFFETFHSVLIAVRNSQGKNMVALEIKELQSIDRQTSALSSHVAGVFQKRLEALKHLGNEAEVGRDETGISSCGTICKTYRKKFAELSERFADLTEMVEPVDDSPDDVRTYFLNVRDRTQSLEAQIQRLGNFYFAADKTTLPTSFNSSMTRISTAITAKEKKYEALLEVDEKSLAILQTTSALRSIFTFDWGAVREIYVLAVVYPLLGSLTIGMLSCMLWRVRSYNNSFDTVGELVKEVQQEREAKEQLEQLAELKRASWRAWITTRFFDRKKPLIDPAPGPVLV